MNLLETKQPIKGDVDLISSSWYQNDMKIIYFWVFVKITDGLQLDVSMLVFPGLQLDSSTIVNLHHTFIAYKAYTKGSVTLTNFL